MRDKLDAWRCEGAPSHLCLMAPASEIVDIMFVMNMGWATNRTECDRLTLYDDCIVISVLGIDLMLSHTANNVGRFASLAKKLPFF